MQIEELISLVSNTASGADNFTKGAVGFNGYGFVFKDFNCGLPYVTFRGSGKAYGAGSHRYGVENFKKFYELENSTENSEEGLKKQFKRLEDLKSLDEFYTIDPEYDLLLAGSLKTLVPSLKFGGYEEFFEVWMFVKTPRDKLFPATFYYGQSGLSIGGWRPDENYVDNREKVFPNKFEKILNFSPYDFTNFEKHLFLDALEFALKKVPISDFWGIYTHDLGNTFMGVEKGKPFIDEMEDFELNSKAKEEIEPLLGKKFETVNGWSFTVYPIPNTYVYVIHFGDDINRFSRNDLWFQGAKETLELIEDLQKYTF